MDKPPPFAARLWPALATLVLALAAAACSGGGADEVAQIRTQSQAATSAQQVVWLNYNGGTFYTCTRPCSDSRYAESFLVGTEFNRSIITLSPSYLGNAARAAIIQDLNVFFRAFNITFTEQRPSGNYTEVAITDQDIPGRSDPALYGISHVDCNNQNPNDISFIWLASGRPALSRLIAHELGHSFGLEHVDPSRTDDLMVAANRTYATGFHTSVLASEGHVCDATGSTQDGYTRLQSGLGARPGVILKYGFLLQNYAVWAPSGRAMFVHQSDGNVVLYRADGKALWATNTSGRSTSYLQMQPGGNMVLVDTANATIWSSQTHTAGAYFILQDDCNGVIYDEASNALWSTGTSTCGF